MLSKPVLLRYFISWLQGTAPAGSTASLERAALGGLGYGYEFAAGLALLDGAQMVRFGIVDGGCGRIGQHDFNGRYMHNNTTMRSDSCCTTRAFT